MAGGQNERFGKFDKHVQRLPDYAQRAGRVMRAYAESKAERQSGATAAGDRSPSRPIGAAVPPVVAEVRDKWVRWNDPAAKHERRKRRTSRALTLWIILSLLSVLYAVVGYAGITGGIDGWQGAFSGLVGTVIFTVFGVRSGIRLYRLSRTTVVSAPRPPALPRTGSAARQPMERLARSEASLTDLLAQLSASADHGTAPVPALSVEQTRATAAEAATALRALAARIESVERAKVSAPAGEQPALNTAIASLRAQLDDGVEEYGALVAAAGRAVAASSGGVSQAKDALTDATDRLAGLASALRDLSSR
ncbi:hypothetical protein SAXI111661_21415 [Saccharomonospora xinjiangensis]|uniref:phage shock envelope stress response protein PspM n=1 Tax=Saccharomonospora xinjiangensis TaxID=75294 RepID=UPI00106F871F|nr:hypothetical protein [Saccharomonospora xinjiangensis]QBQ61151.1 hypothetical protein EYD13_13995 [Saccharomonospora xinjiangensis]